VPRSAAGSTSGERTHAAATRRTPRTRAPRGRTRNARSSDSARVPEFPSAAIEARGPLLEERREAFLRVGGVEEAGLELALEGEAGLERDAAAGLAGSLDGARGEGRAVGETKHARAGHDVGPEGVRGQDLVDEPERLRLVELH